MAIWIISGSAMLAAWAVLSVMGGELTRRTQIVQTRFKTARAKAEAD